MINIYETVEIPIGKVERVEKHCNGFKLLVGMGYGNNTGK